MRAGPTSPAWRRRSRPAISPRPAPSATPSRAPRPPSDSPRPAGSAPSSRRRRRAATAARSSASHPCFAPACRPRAETAMENVPVSFVDAFLLALAPVAAVVLAIAFVLLRRRQRALVEANAAVASERDRIRFALEGSSLTIWDWDVASDSMWLNANWKQMLGAEPGESRAPIADLFALVHRDDVERVKQAAIDALKGTAERFDAEFRIRANDGTWLWIRTR